jgi:hypothetical protein
MESAVPLEDGLNDETFGIVVGKRVGKDILSTHVIIPIERDLEKEIHWILHEFKHWGNKTEVVGIIVSHISNSGFGLSSFEAQSLKTLMTGIKFGQFDWDVYILDKRNDTEIEPELATEDFELDISNLTNEIHLNEQEFDDVIFNEFDRSWSFSGNLN